MRIAFVAALTVALTASAAAQAHEKLAVGSLDVSGEPGTPPERLDRLRANLVGGFAAAGWVVIPEAEVETKVADNPALASCQSDVCFQALGQTVGARWVLAGSLHAGTSTSYAADVHLIDVETGRRAAQYSNSCGVCTTTEANNWLGLIAADLKRQVEASRPVVTPAPAPAQPAPRTTARQWAFRGAAIGAATLAVGGFVFGGIESSRDGRLCTPIPPATDCTPRRDTTAGQLFGYITGGALLAGAAVLAYYGFWHHPERKVAVVPGLSPTSITATLVASF